MNYKREGALFVGMDIHKEFHAAVMTDCWGELIATYTVENMPSKYPKFLKEVLRKADGKPVIFGLEDVSQYGRGMAEYLLSQKQIVKEVNSSYTKHERRRSTSPDKTDFGDARSICDTLIRKLNELPNANPQDIYWALQQVLSNYEFMNKTASALMNNIHTQLMHHYPGYNKLFSDIDGKTSIAFFEKFPHPALLLKAQPNELIELLHKSKYSPSPRVIQEKAKQILLSVKEAGYKESSQQETQNELIRSLFRQLSQAKAEIEKAEKQMDELLSKSPYKLSTMPGMGTILAATIVADIGDIRRYRSSDCIAKMAGIAPTNKSSGNNQWQVRNRFGKRRLHYAFYMLALNQIAKDNKGKEPRNPIIYEYYMRKQKEGRQPKQAMIFVMRRLVNVVYGMMKSGEAYRPPA